MSDQQSGFHHQVRQGDSTTSVAWANGFFWETVWNHGENSELKSLRKKPNILFPGDKLFVPPLSKKQVDKACEQRHKFKRKGVPEKLKMRFLDHKGEPYKDEPYTLTIDGAERRGTLDADGFFDEWVPPGAKKAVVLVGEEGKILTLALDIGGMDPTSETAGVQKRLQNLGYYSGATDGQDSPEFAAAVARFRQEVGLSEAGGVDDELRAKLEELHKT